MCRTVKLYAEECRELAYGVFKYIPNRIALALSLELVANKLSDGAYFSVKIDDDFESICRELGIDSKTFDEYGTDAQ